MPWEKTASISQLVLVAASEGRRQASLQTVIYIASYLGVWMSLVFMKLSGLKAGVTLCQPIWAKYMSAISKLVLIPDLLNSSPSCVSCNFIWVAYSWATIKQHAYMKSILNLHGLGVPKWCYESFLYLKSPIWCWPLCCMCQETLVFSVSKLLKNWVLAFSFLDESCIMISCNLAVWYLHHTVNIFAGDSSLVSCFCVVRSFSSSVKHTSEMFGLGKKGKN